MIPAGYFAKNVTKRPNGLKADNVIDIYSVSGHLSEPFAADYDKFWKHNRYWFFNTPEMIEELARDNGLDISSALFFYYEVFDKQYDEHARTWHELEPWPSLATSVHAPVAKQLEGYDVVSFSMGNAPECSPLSCSSLAESLPVNCHCLLASFEDARAHLEAGRFDKSEPGPFRIFAVYSVPKPGPLRVSE